MKTKAAFGVFRTVFSVLIVFYFVVFGIATICQKMAIEQFTMYGAIIGGIFGAITIFAPKLEKKDFDDIGSEIFEEIVRRQKELEEIQKKREEEQSTLGGLESKIDELENKRDIMESMVRQASMKIFLEEHRKHLIKAIRELISDNSELHLLVASLISCDDKIVKINGEIEKAPDVDLLKDIIKSATESRKELPAFENVFLQILKSFFVR